jgi:hypothetical protein
MANHAAIQQQHGHLQPIAADELGISIHIHDLDRRQRVGAAQFGKLVEHVVTEPTAFATDDDEARWNGVSRVQKAYFRRGAGGAIPSAWVAVFEAFT